MCQEDGIPSRGSRGESIFFLYRLVEATHIPWLLAPLDPFSFLKARDIASPHPEHLLLLLHLLSLTLTLLHPP